MKQGNTEVHFVNLLNDSLELSEEQQVRMLNVIANNLNIKPLKVVAKEVGKSYNGLKDHGNPIVIAGKYFGISKVVEF